MTKTLHKTYRLATAMAAVAVFAPVLPVSAEVTYDTLALAGDQAPGTAKGVLFSHFAAPTINDAGQIAFGGTIRGKGVDNYTHTNDKGLWSDRSGSLKLIVRDGDPAPDLEGVGGVFTGVYCSLNDTGQIEITSTARVYKDKQWKQIASGRRRYKNITGIWLERSGSLKLVVSTGDEAPGTHQAFNRVGSPLLFNDAGHFAFRGEVSRRNKNISGIWSQESGSLKLVARTGTVAPGIAQRTVFRSVGAPFLLNGTGPLAFRGTLSGSDGMDITGIWSQESGSLKLVSLCARRGDAAPGTDGVFQRSPVPVYNAALQIAFLGKVKGMGNGIWSDRSGSLKLIVRNGDTAPGTAEGRVFSLTDDATSVLINNAGQIAFSSVIRVKDSRGPLDGTNGIWSEGSGSLKLVVRTDDAAPGTPEGVVFSGFSDLVFNNAGQTAFLGKIRIKDSAYPIGDLTGLWATAPNGQIMLIAREGDLFDVDDDPHTEDLRTISEVKFGTFNDAGQLAFKLDFTGGGKSGIFVATVSNSPTAAVTPIETTQQRNTHATENQTTTDATPITQSQQPQAGSNRGNVDRPEITTPVLPVSEEVTYDTRALVGDTAPGTGETFNSFYGFAFNDAGQLAFAGNVNHTSNRGTWSTYSGIWSDRSSTLKLVARAADTAPGTAEGTVFKSLDRPAINDAGQIAFGGGVRIKDRPGPLKGTPGIWSEGSGSLKLVALEGDAAPGTDMVFTRIGTPVPVINGAGQVTFGGYTNNPGVWSDRSGSLKLVARTGHAPGTDKRVFITDFDPVVNGTGQIAFYAERRGRKNARGRSRPTRGIWSDRSGSLKLIVRRGDPAPGTDPGMVFSSLGTPVINGAGQIAFGGNYFTPTNRGVQTPGIWSEGSGSLKLVVRRGDAAPGTNGVFTSLDSLVINGAGQIAFIGGIRAKDKLGRSVNLAGIWSEGSGSLKLIALEGDRLPGMDEGVESDGFFKLVLNDAGQIAFYCSLSSRDSGLWATDPNGQIMLIAREGDLFDINDDPLIDDLRTVYGLIDGSGNHMQLSFNDAGQLAFYLPFSKGSGIFVASLPNSVTAVMDPPIQTKPLLETTAAESQTAQDGTPPTQPQQQQARSDRDDHADEQKQEGPDEEDRPEKTDPITDITQKTKDAVKKAKSIFDIFH